MKKNNWRQLLPELNQRIDEQSGDLLDSANIVGLPEQHTVFRQGDICKNYLIILKGKVKVFTRAENGREILLYRLQAGDSCVLTTSCLFGNQHYPAEGVTESAVTALAIPASRFNDAIQQSASFRDLVFSAFSTHLSELITLVEEVAFGKLDVRLAKLLLTHRDGNDTLHSTHQSIATELGTAREVVSRQLKYLESKGYIILQRGNIQIVNVTALQDISQD